jgi:hypothetical protein
VCVREEQLGFHRTDFRDICYLINFRKSVENIQVSLKYDEQDGTLQEDQYAVLIISHSILLRMRNFSDEICIEKIQEHILCSVTFSENPAVYEIMWKTPV